MDHTSALLLSKIAAIFAALDGMLVLFMYPSYLYWLLVIAESKWKSLAFISLS